MNTQVRYCQNSLYDIISEFGFQNSLFVVIDFQNECHWYYEINSSTVFKLSINYVFNKK